MPYLINDEWFRTKDDVKGRCRAILAGTADGALVTETDAEFLYELFQFHDEWAEKSETGVEGITAQMTVQGTRCFVLRRHCGTEVDISFKHSADLIPSSRSRSRQPQGLTDFRNGARTAIRNQIRSFRDQAFASTSVCPLSGESLSRFNAAVDHIAPSTFDQLLFDFCRANQINPLKVVVGSREGVVATLEDADLRFAWERYHLSNAQLRLISRIENLKLPKASLPWMVLCSGS